ncbi:hypothetical protein [Janthinobacterium sp. AD80]|uniref:GapS1 family protein n=1 Tax=Janthinobacterium sp. AD80 TaxID=1528773 RepID=UPI000CBF5A22|nr:hypothetical protein [Janthinobacterium sp. AD80]PMQ16931.1 hypothetical protein JaAD80_07970 [Janthinobacterium sp. AD80]
MTYNESIKKIISEIGNYSKHSILNESLGYLSSIGIGYEERARAMPHIIYLLIKWSMLSKGHNKIKISAKEFSKIINKIFKVQNLAANLNPNGNFGLKLRVMLMQQTIPQKNYQHYLITLSRQKYWFEGKDDSPYNVSFKKITGISLSSFYSIAFYISACAIPLAKKIEYINFSNLVTQLSPKISIEEIAATIKLLSLKPGNISSYLKNFELDENPIWEYFADTPLINKPLLINEDSISFIEKDLFLRSASDFVSRTLKAGDIHFKNNFGKTMENYIDELFKNHGITHLNEADISEIYKKLGKKSKIVDFIIIGDVNIYLDSKAIEPNSLVTTSHDPDVLKRSLEASYIKAIFQGQECCHTLTQNKTLDTGENFLLVVVHQDHYISSGTTIQELIYPELSDTLIKKFGHIPIPLNNIYYITIDDLEMLIEMESQKKHSINEILKSSVIKDSKPETQCMLFSMHIEKKRRSILEQYLATNMRKQFQRRNKSN